MLKWTDNTFPAPKPVKTENSLYNYSSPLSGTRVSELGNAIHQLTKKFTTK